MKSSKTSFLRNCISGWNVRCNLVVLVFAGIGEMYYLCTHIWNASLAQLVRASDC